MQHARIPPPPPFGRNSKLIFWTTGDSTPALYTGFTGNFCRQRGTLQTPSGAVLWNMWTTCCQIRRYRLCLSPRAFDIVGSDISIKGACYFPCCRGCAVFLAAGGVLFSLEGGSLSCWGRVVFLTRGVITSLTRGLITSLTRGVITSLARAVITSLTRAVITSLEQGVITSL